MQTYSWVIRFGLLTGSAIIGFQIIGLFVIYRYLKLDYYLSLVAIVFLAAGFLLNKRFPEISNASSQNEPKAPAETIVLPEPAPHPDLLTLLTSREFLILRLLAEGKTNKEIAITQFVEVSTVKTHINNIYSKLSVTNRAQARASYVEMTQKFPVS